LLRSRSNSKARFGKRSASLIARNLPTPRADEVQEAFASRHDVVACPLHGIDLAAAKARNIAVLNTPDVLTDSVADAAILLLLGAARDGKYRTRAQRPLDRLDGSTAQRHRALREE
jgi:phosphoglycerate dehydrogenase-like enzyme